MTVKTEVTIALKTRRTAIEGGCYGFIISSRSFPLLVGGEVPAEFREEVAVEDDRDTHEEGGINGMLLKQTVDVGTVTAQLSSEPGDASLLTHQLFADDCTDWLHL